LGIVLGAVGAGVAFLMYCCCRVAGEADARMEALEKRLREEDSRTSG